MNTFNQFFFGIFPYIALSIFFFGSLLRFDREQYTWKSDSSQLLYRGQLRLGNILFHVGILMVFFGHLFGLLTPVWFWDAIGISHSAKQMIAIVLGGVFGLMAMAGLLILLNRRLKSDRLAANATWRDKLVLIWLIATLALGLLTIFASSPFLFMRHRSRGMLGHFKHFLVVTGGPEDFRIDRFELIHYLALGFGLGIVVLAKLMFIL